MPGSRRSERLRGQPHEIRQMARRRRMAERMAAADSPERQVGVASDHLRAALRFVSPAAAEQIAREAVTALNQAVERAYREEARR